MSISLICSLIEVDAEHRAEFLDFHNREHIPERVAIPGFHSGRRFVSAANPNLFLIVYEVDALAVLTSKAYLARLNDPTEWTRRCLSFIRSSDRMAIGLGFSLGIGHGGHACLLRGDPAAAQLSPPGDAARLLALPGIVAVRGGWINPEASDVDTAERQALAAPPHERDAVMLIEAASAESLRQAIAEAAPAMKTDAAYRLQFSLTDRQAR